MPTKWWGPTTSSGTAVHERIKWEFASFQRQRLASPPIHKYMMVYSEKPRRLINSLGDPSTEKRGMAQKSIKGILFITRIQDGVLLRHFPRRFVQMEKRIEILLTRAVWIFKKTSQRVVDTRNHGIISFHLCSLFSRENLRRQPNRKVNQNYACSSFFFW